jgi:hypothetical protein
LAISVALWQGMRAPEGDICCAPIGLANAPQAIAVTVAKRARRRIAISSLTARLPRARRRHLAINQLRFG